MGVAILLVNRFFSWIEQSAAIPNWGIVRHFTTITTDCYVNIDYSTDGRTDTAGSLGPSDPPSFGETLFIYKHIKMSYSGPHLALGDGVGKKQFKPRNRFAAKE